MRPRVRAIVSLSVLRQWVDWKDLSPKVPILRICVYTETLNSRGRFVCSADTNFAFLDDANNIDEKAQVRHVRAVALRIMDRVRI